MGNEQIKKNTDVDIELNHSRINSIKVINDIKQRYMQSTFSIQQSDYDSWKQNISNSKSNTQYLLWPLNHSFSSKALCGNTGSVKIDYDNYPYLLKEQITNRKAMKKKFDQTELWQLLYCLVQAQKQMKNGSNSKIGDIRPDNVFLNEEGMIKVANLLSWPKQNTNYQKFLQNQITYLAPQDMKFVQSSSLDNDSNKLSQIFSIGLTVLSAANLTDYKKLYDTKSLNFNIQQFNRTLHQWRLNQVYSDIFKATVSSLIQIDLQQRISQYELQPWILKYKAEILSRQDFIINDPPHKIINQIAYIRKVYESVGGFGVQPIVTQPIIHGAEHKRVISTSNVGVFPLEGSRRLVDEKRLPPITVIPGTTAVESVYTPNDRFASNFILPGVNVHQNISTSTNNQVITTTQSYKHYQANSIPSYQGTFTNSTYIPKMNIEYKSSPVTQHLRNVNINESAERQESEKKIQQNGNSNQTENIGEQ